MTFKPHPFTDRICQWIINVVNPNAFIKSVHKLPGATSSLLYTVVVKEGEKERSLVLREFNNVGWLADEPDIAWHEACSLNMAARTGLPVPKLIACDKSGEVCGLPAILMSHLKGKVVLKPDSMQKWLHQLADALKQIHRVNADDFSWNYFSYNDIDKITIPEWSQVPDIWKLAINYAKKPRSEYKSCFIHRDYHPANVLWHDGKISGVVDWANACSGPAGIDIGHCRWNLAMLYGIEIADQFLAAYQAIAGSTFYYDPYWDILSVIDTLSGSPTVYSGWRDFGITELTDALMVERTDMYIENLVKKAKL